MLSPSALGPASAADEFAFALTFLLFEGKMRALFTILFGASMVLFVERAEAARKSGDALQLRRLGWLMLFGYLHYLLLWWGDILFSYALAGALVLPLRQLRPRVMIAGALILFTVAHVSDFVARLPAIATEEALREGTADSVARSIAAELASDRHDYQASEMMGYRSGIVEHARIKLENAPGYPLQSALGSLGETVPLMLLGMALLRGGFFAGGWPRHRLRTIAMAGVAFGGAWTLAALAWLLPRHFPLEATSAAIVAGNAPAHLAMAIGYAAALVLAAPWLTTTAAGRKLIAAGRMAFSNYIGTTVVMCAIFYGWGLSLIGQVPWAGLWPFVLLGWALMLGASGLWLARFRQGPLEWLWRSLTELRPLPLRREKPLAIETNSH